MGKIVLLDDLTINKIAAGEVIERPASVVKELVENAIDAGSTKIEVEIKNGGISYIRVKDNGKGIMPDDMELSFERHATSKIRSAEDLSTVTSMGFRGEALASITAIARVEMRTKTIDTELGYRIVVEGGNVLEKEECGCPNGTNIVIENLFYNTPVRYKFLKKDFTEAGYIEDIITRIALINTKIAIKLISSGKTVIQTTGNGSLKDAVYSIYGKEIAENIIDVVYSYEDIKVTGIIGKPNLARSNRSNQLFFINKRFVKDKNLTAAAEQAYKGMITIGKFGFSILNLEMNPEKVDVNVHPAKLEVRFEEESKVFKAVYHAIKDNLLKGDLVTDTEKDYTQKEETPMTWKINNIEETKVIEKPKGGLFSRFGNKIVNPSTQELEQNVLEEVFQKRETEQIPIITEEQIKENGSKFNDIMQKMQEMQETVEIAKEEQAETKIAEKAAQKQAEVEDITQKQEEVVAREETEQQEEKFPVKDFEEMYTTIFGKTATTIEETEKEYILEDIAVVKGENISVFQKEAEIMIPQYKFLGIAFRTYIMIELNNELYMIDQHAAHERIMYEKVKKNYYNDENKDSQLMLLPDIITLTHKDMLVAKDNMQMFKKAGFELEEFGENTIKLTGVPNICLDLDTKELFLETLDEINTVARTAKQEIEERFIATVACKAAVKAHMALTEVEVDSLMEDLLKLPNPFTCPHGRPTAIKMTKADIEKKFSRR